MQREIDQMIPQRGVTPEPVLKPKQTVQQRIVAVKSPNLKPDAMQSVQRAEFRTRDVLVIVKKISAVPSRLIDQKHRRH